ncbi:MAG: alpha/beta hydrolase, partial [Deltaproteobacteria bacterium]|nr:alpha/beta hydrolase [Deltaproteobacteria bacterium]
MQKAVPLFAVVFAAALTLLGCGAFVDRLPSGQIPDPSPQDKFVTVDGIRIHYQEWENPGEDVVLIHGYASSTYTWKDVAPVLADHGYHVYAVDLKGFGWSDKPGDDRYAPEDFMECVNSWMDAVGLESAVLAGNSMGGFISALMALEHPEKVEQLILVDAAG